MSSWTAEKIENLRERALLLRQAQETYLKLRESEDKHAMQVAGQAVGEFGYKMDQALQQLMHSRGEPAPHQDVARGLVEACLGLRSAQHAHLRATLLEDKEAAKRAGQSVGLAAEVLDDVLDSFQAALNRVVDETPGFSA